MSLATPTMRAPSGAFLPSLAILVAVTAVNPMAVNIYVPSMPGVQAHFAAPATMVQLTLSLGLVGTAVTQPIIGPLSDQFGRRPILLGGLLIAAIASFLGAFSGSLEMLIVWRIIQVASGAAGLVLGRAIVRDIRKPSEAASMLGYVTMGMAMAPMVAPIIGGFLDDLASWRAGFVFAGVMTVIAVVWAWYALPETNKHLGQASSLRAMLADYRALLGLRSFWIYTLISAFTVGTFFSFLGGAPYVSQNLFHLTPTHYGLYFGLVAIGYSLGNFLSGRYASQLGLYRMILFGCLLTLASSVAVVVLCLFGLEGPAYLFGATFFLGIGNGLVMPSASVGVVSVLPRLAGSASGLSGSIMTLISAGFSYIVAFMLTDSVLPMGLLMCFTALVALFFSFRVKSIMFVEAD
nr:multidrug effflux MFS transporter [uncultured Cohaesibacter sp.]